MTSHDSPAVPPGWYPDPANPTQERYWDGMRWTQTVRHLQMAPPPGHQTRGMPDPAANLPLASWGRRFGSGIVDTAVAWALTLGVLTLAVPSFLRDWAHLYLEYGREFRATMLAGGAMTMPSAALQNQTTSLMLVAGGVSAVYCVLFLGTWGATLGHRLWGVKVVKAPLPLALLAAAGDKPFTVEKPGWLRSVSKGLSWALFSTGGGIFMIIQLVNIVLPLWQRRKQSVTDLFASTLLIRTKRDTHVST